MLGLRYNDEAVDWWCGGNADGRGHDHGIVSGANNCAGCHVVGEEQAMKTTRPQRQAKRSRPALFNIEVQAHPHITGANGEKPENCRSCHIAEAALVPSRIQQSRFRHGPHLKNEGDTKQCLTCHQPKKPRSLGFMEFAGQPEMLLSYDIGACNSCHKGVSVLQASEYRRSPGRSALFNHDDHINPKDPKKSLDCGSCHVAKANGDRDYDFNVGVQDCSKCHNHKEHAADTGGKNQEYVRGCVACHEKHVPGIPANDEDYSISRVDVQSLAADQYHPAPKDMSCQSCHKRGVTTRRAEVGKQNHVVSNLAGYDSRDGFHSTQMKKSQGAATFNPQYCFNCHWGNLQLIKSNPSSAVIDGVETSIRNKPYADRFKERLVRKKLGGEMKGYPGLLKK